MRREESRHDFAFIAGVIVGAVSGALVTLALTPMSGAETREKVMERVGDLEPVKERAAGLAESAQHLVETSRVKAADLVAKSPLPFGEQAESDNSSDATATVHGGVAHPREPAEEAPEAVEGDGLAVVEPQPETSTRPAAGQS